MQSELNTLNFALSTGARFFPRSKSLFFVQIFTTKRCTEFIEVTRRKVEAHSV
jgi:hypothetical protein